MNYTKCGNCENFLNNESSVKYCTKKGLTSLPEYFCCRKCFEEKYITKCNSCGKFCTFEISVLEHGNTKYYCDLDCYKGEYNLANNLVQMNEIDRSNKEAIDIAKRTYVYQKRSNSVAKDRGQGKTAMLTNILDQLDYPYKTGDFSLDKISIV